MDEGQERMAPIRCPYCKKNHEFRLGSNQQVIDIHRSDEKISENINEKRVECPITHKGIHLVLINGYIIAEKYHHPIENFLNRLSGNRRNISISPNSNIVIAGFSTFTDVRYVISFILGFLSFTVIPNLTYILLGHPDLIGQYWDVVYGIVGGFALMLGYRLVKEMKIIGSRIIGIINPKNYQNIEYAYRIMTSGKQLAIISALVLLTNSADNLSIDMWVWEAGSVFKDIITGFGIQIIAAYILLLIQLGRIKLSGDYFIRTQRMKEISNVGAMIFSFVVLSLFGKFVAQWLLISSWAKEIATYLLVYAIVIPIAGIVIGIYHQYISFT